MKKILIIALVLVMVGCRTVKQEVCQTEISKERSVENESIFVYIHDSVATIIRDTSIVSEVKYRDRLVERVVYKTDTVVQVDQHLVETVVEKKVVPKWAWWCLVACIIAVSLLIIGVVLKIKRVV